MDENTTTQTGEEVTLNVWYADESLQAYIEGAAKSYEEKNLYFDVYAFGLKFVFYMFTNFG